MTRLLRLCALEAAVIATTLGAMLCFGAPVGRVVMLVGARLAMVGGGHPVTSQEEVVAIAEDVAARTAEQVVRYAGPARVVAVKR